jgi:nitroreductase/dihydropteridine reductase
MKLLGKLKWSYLMNGKKVTPQKTENIIELASLSPSSSILQSFKILVIPNTEVKEKIKPIVCNQFVTTDRSHLFFFAAWERLYLRKDQQNV